MVMRRKSAAKRRERADARGESRWGNPVHRKKYLEGQKVEQVQAMGAAILSQGGEVLEVASNAWDADGSLWRKDIARVEGEGRDAAPLMRLRRMSPRARRLVYVLLDPLYANAEPRVVASAAKVPWGFARRCMLLSRDFWPFMDRLRESAFRHDRHRIAEQVVRDAQVSLEDVHPAKASALVATRAQAAAIVGLTVEAPKLEVSQEISVNGELSAIRARVTKMLESGGGE